jgi:ABC-type sugar transport system substrate-binding protein
VVGFRYAGPCGPARHVRTGVAAVGAVTLIGLLAACGSSASGGSSAQPTASGSLAAGVKTADRLVAQYEQRPRSIGITQKISKPVPSGKTLLFMDPGLPVTHANLVPLQKAAAVLGWTVKDVNVGLTPQSIQAGFQQAIAEHPSGLISVTTNTSLFQRQCKQLAALHIPVFDQNVATTDAYGYGNCVVGDAENEKQVGGNGKLMADYVIADSRGQADVLYVTDPSLSILTSITTQFNDEMGSLCGTCKVTTLNVQSAQIGQQIPGQITNYIEAHPSIKYVVASYDDLLLGVSSALKAAEISDVKSVGEDPEPANLTDIAGGGIQVATVTPGNFEVEWRVIDMAARYFAGTSLAPDETDAPPYWILTKSNQETWPGSAKSYPWPNVADYVQQYSALWGK